jgi:hypothetical protein
MANGNPHGVVIEPRMRELHTKLQKLSVPDELWKIIHGNGWTTLIDVYFIQQNVEAMHQHADALQTQLNTLLVGSRMIADEAK